MPRPPYPPSGEPQTIDQWRAWTDSLRDRVAELEDVVIRAFDTTPKAYRMFSAIPVPVGALLATLTSWNFATQNFRAKVKE